MSINEKKTLGELLSDPRIRPIASDAITGMDLKREGLWDKSIEQLRKEQFGGGLTPLTAENGITASTAGRMLRRIPPKPESAWSGFLPKTRPLPPARIFCLFRAAALSMSGT